MTVLLEPNNATQYVTPPGPIIIEARHVPHILELYPLLEYLYIIARSYYILIYSIMNFNFSCFIVLCERGG